MIIEDNRLDRTVIESIAVTSTYTENDLEGYDCPFEDRDHRMLISNVDWVAEQIDDDPNTRRAIVTAADANMCIQGVHVLLRDRLHVLSWFRSSDIETHRDEDLGFLYEFGCIIREKLDLDAEILVHVFSSSLHSETEGKANVNRR